MTLLDDTYLGENEPSWTDETLAEARRIIEDDLARNPATLAIWQAEDARIRAEREAASGRSAA